MKMKRFVALRPEGKGKCLRLADRTRITSKIGCSERKPTHSWALPWGPAHLAFTNSGLGRPKFAIETVSRLVPLGVRKGRGEAVSLPAITMEAVNLPDDVLALLDPGGTYADPNAADLFSTTSYASSTTRASPRSPSTTVPSAVQDRERGGEADSPGVLPAR